MEKIVSLCRRRGFVFPSSEIYGGLGSAYDYGHYGVLLKENVKARWLEAMVQERDDIVALDSAIILHPSIWEASGHVGGLHRPARRLPHCKQRFRADHLAIRAEQCGKRPSKRPGETQRLRPHRGAPVQPHVRDAGRPRRGDRPARSTSAPRRRRASSSTSRTSPSSPAASRRSGSRRSASRSATRSRQATSSSARSSSSRWRWSSSSRPPRRTSGSATGSRSGSAGTSRYGIRPESAARSAARRRRALALLERDERHRVPLPDRLVGARGDREPRRRSTSTRTPRRPGTTARVGRLRAPASATSRT